MGLETAQYIAELVETNPPGGDKKKEGDNQIRLIKAVLKTTFPDLDHAVVFGGYEAKTPGVLVKAVTYDQLEEDDGKLIYFDCSGGARAYNLLALASAADGFFVFIDRDATLANDLTIDGSSSETINGATTLTVRAGESGVLYKASTEWRFFYSRSTWTFLKTLLVTLAAVGDAAVFQCDAASASRGPDVVTYRNRNGVNNDQVGSFTHRGKNTAGTDKVLTRFRGKWIDVAAGSEDAFGILSALVADVEVDALSFGAGVIVGAPTVPTPNPDPGVGKINVASAILINGQQITNMLVARDYQEIVGPQSTVTGQIDLDDSLPGISEGEQLFTKAWTPKNATNKVRISGDFIGCHESGAGNELILALFKDSTCVRTWRIEEVSNSAAPLHYAYEEVAGSTTARTYSLRWGASSAAGHTLNNGADGFDLGDSMATTFLIEEFLA